MSETLLFLLGVVLILAALTISIMLVVSVISAANSLSAIRKLLQDEIALRRYEEQKKQRHTDSQ